MQNYSKIHVKTKLQPAIGTFYKANIRKIKMNHSRWTNIYNYLY